MLFTRKTPPGGYEIEKEGNLDILRINYEGNLRVPSIENDPSCMAFTVDKLVEVPSASRIIFHQRRNYTYDFNQVQLLVEVANFYNHLIKQKKLFLARGDDPFLSNIKSLVLTLLKSDPLGAFVEIKRLLREEKINLKKETRSAVAAAMQARINVLQNIYSSLEKIRLIIMARPYLDGYTIGDRSVYKKFFRPMISPDFMFTKLMGRIPLHADEMDAYKIDKNTEVKIFTIPGNLKYLYHLTPPEFKLSEDQYELLDLAKNVLAEHKPTEEEFIDPDRMRQTFYNIGTDLIQELSEHKNIGLSLREIKELANILVRYTVGFGLIEVLLKDKKVQDITINGPIGQTPIFLVHQDFDDCLTNIYPAREDGDGWATKFRLLSGRPLDEANPVLDTELIVPGAKARVAIIGNPLNPWGLGYAFRRHRDKPWTLPLFINNNMLSPLAAGLISFLVDGSRTMLVAGTRSSGKTSLLGSVLVEIMKKYRLITLEDTLELPTEALRNLGYNIQPMKVRSALSLAGKGETGSAEGIRTSLRMGDSSLIVGEIRSSIRGNEKVVIIEKGETKRIPIKDLENKDINDIHVPVLDFNLKTKLVKLTGFVKHPKRKKLLRVKTRTGREVTVTPDHSLFTSHNFRVYPIECKDLKTGSKIVLPSKLPSGYNNIEYFNLLDLIQDARVENFEEPIKKVISNIGWKKATAICNIKCGDIYNFYRRNQKTNMPIESFNNLMQFTSIEPKLEELNIKNGTSNTLKALFPVNNDFCRFLGYFISEGYFSESSIKISNNNKNIFSDIISLSRAIFDVKPHVRETKGLGKSKQIVISNSPLVKLFKKLGCGRTSKEKRIPSFIFGLSNPKIFSFLSGLYAGDGNFTSSESSGNAIRYYTTSFDLADDLMYLLLHVGIVARLAKKKSSGLSNNPIYVVEFKNREFVKKFLDNVDFVKYSLEIVEKSASHSNLNTASYDIKDLEKHLKLTRDYRHLRKYSSCGKDFLKRITSDKNTQSDDFIKTFANGEFYLDEVKEIEEINLEEGEYVYDLSVDHMQNFVGGTGGILLHNTEAKALYEAMRVGALANVVAGTIHGDSPYGVFDRVVNDLEVPKTSFKATDIIVVANPIKSPDGLHRWRRITQITEVRKHWQDDPLREKGFVDLMRYDGKQDYIVPTDDLLNGDSDILKGIAGNVKEWIGDWDAVWDNILLRAKIKETIVSYANKSKNLDLLEAESVIESNDMFHRISDSVRSEVGSLDNKRIYQEWEEWFRRYVREKKGGT